MQRSRFKVGIVSNEFFDQKNGYGGFGWAAMSTAKLFLQNPQWGFDPVFLTGRVGGEGPEGSCHEIRILFPEDSWGNYVARLRSENINALLLIDYRAEHDLPLAALPQTPVIVWVRDPRPLEDVAEVSTLQIPGNSEPPQGIEPIDCLSFQEFFERSKQTGRPVIFGSPAPQLLHGKAQDTYGVKISELNLLPNPIEPISLPQASRARRVIFLGRLDPIKRPWIFAEVGRRFPQVEFLFLGKAHFKGVGTWKAESLPSNVRLCGHVNGQEKLQLLASSSLLLNSSIHEALPVSFLEVLACEIPIVSCQNPEGITFQFGYFVKNSGGNGLDLVEEFCRGVEKLLADENLRKKLGEAGRKWVLQNHTPETFRCAFQELLVQAEVSKPRQQDVVGMPQPWGLALWQNERALLKQELGQIIPRGTEYIFVDHDFEAEFVEERRAFPFLERNGEYFGPPEDDATAIAELERMRRQNLSLIAFSSWSFWWFDSYPEFNEYLRRRYRCVCSNERVVVFDLRGQ